MNLRYFRKTFDMVVVYGIDPIVYTFASIASAICILIYVIFNYIIANEFQIFNEELEEEAKQEKLIVRIFTNIHKKIYFDKSVPK